MNKVAAVPATNLLAKISNAFQFNTNATVTPIVMIKVMRILTCVEVSFPKFQALYLNPWLNKLELIYVFNFVQNSRLQYNNRVYLQ